MELLFLSFISERFGRIELQGISISLVNEAVFFYSVAYVSRSGGMSNELNNIISQKTDGVYEGIAIGGDRYPGSTFVDHFLRYEQDERYIETKWFDKQEMLEKNTFFVYVKYASKSSHSSHRY